MKISTLTASCAQHLVWPLVRSLYSLDVVGVEHVTQAGRPLIFASNHLSEIDPLLLVAALPFDSNYLPLVFVSREPSFYAGVKSWRRFFYGGILFKLIGALPAYPGLHNYNRALIHHLCALQNNQSVAIFPVGKRHADTDIAGARGGVAFLACETNTPIIPVRIRAVPQTGKKRWLTRKKYQIIFGEVCSFASLTTSMPALGEKNEYEQKAFILMERIISLGE